MIKFEEHDGMLFKMLDKPVPYESQLKWNYIAGIAHDKPLLIRTITKIMNPRVSIKTLNDLSKVKYVVHYDMPAEIIGTFVEEGSAEWALYQMMKGKKVTKQHLQDDSGNIYWCFCDRLRCVQEFNCGTLQITVIPEIWVKTADKCGWQLYEPKPEPFASVKKGDLIMCSDGVERKVLFVSNIEDIRSNKLWFNLRIDNSPLSNISTFYFNGTLQQTENPLPFTLCYICEPKQNKPAFKVWDWVEFNDGVRIGQAIVMRTYDDLYVVRDYLYSMYEFVLNKEYITRKLKASEVIVKIGCLSGTIAKSCDPNYFLMLHSRPITDCNHSMIRFSAIDKETRSLVESLLKAMRGES